MEKFLIGKTLSESWHLVKGTKRALVFNLFGILILSILNRAVHAYFANQPSQAHTLLFNLLISLIIMILTAPIVGGLFGVGLKRAQGETVGWTSGMDYFNRTWQLAMILIIESVIVLGFIFLINMLFFQVTAVSHTTANPGHLALALIIFEIIVLVVLEVLFSLSIFFQLDRNFNPIKAIIQSIKVSWRHFGKLLLLLVILAIFNTIGGLAFAIGLFWTIPLSVIALAKAYLHFTASGITTKRTST